MLDYDRLVEVFECDYDGYLYNRHSRGRAKAGERAGYLDVHNYWRVVIDYKKYYVHHLVWFYVHGEWPSSELDHIDGDSMNNAPANLRLCSRSQNNWNSQRPTGESGLRGAYLDKRNQRWYSHIQFGGQVKHLGMFDTAEEAHKAFEIAAEQLHGEFYFPPPNLTKDLNPWP